MRAKCPKVQVHHHSLYSVALHVVSQGVSMRCTDLRPLVLHNSTDHFFDGQGGCRAILQTDAFQR